MGLGAGMDEVIWMGTRGPGGLLQVMDIVYGARGLRGHCWGVLGGAPLSWVGVVGTCLFRNLRFTQTSWWLC